MHPSFQERIDELGVLLQKIHAARIEFFNRVDQVMPPKKVRFQVKAVGEAYHVVELSSGKTKAFRWTYKAAMDIAMQFEDKANRPVAGVQ